MVSKGGLLLEAIGDNMISCLYLLQVSWLLGPFLHHPGQQYSILFPLWPLMSTVTTPPFLFSCSYLSGLVGLGPHLEMLKDYCWVWLRNYSHQCSGDQMRYGDWTLVGSVQRRVYLLYVHFFLSPFLLRHLAARIFIWFLTSKSLCYVR